MPKFDFGYGTLNNIKLPVVGGAYGLEERPNRYKSGIRAVEKAFEPDILEDTGPYKAVVLRVEKSNDGKVEPEGFLDFVYNLFKGDDKPANSGIKQMTQIKARVPELHGHLPLPSGDTDPSAADYPDHYIIDMYPTYTSESDRAEFTKLKPGDIVIVDYGDKENMTDPVIITPIAVQQHIPPMTGPGSAGSFSNLPCSDPSGQIVGNAMAGSTSAATHAGVSDDATRARSTNAMAVMFGDSQMSGKLGKALSDYAKSLGYTVKGSSGIGSGGRMHRGSSAVSAWVKSGKEKDPSGGGKWGFVEAALKSHNPELIIICLGGNGVGKGNPTKLIKKIRGVSANSKILWVGPPPASIATDEKAAAAKFPKAFRENGKNWAVATRAAGRVSRANLIEAEIGNMPNVSYINTPKILPNYPNSPGPGTDGVHMSANGAVQLINKIKKTASPAAAGSATPDKAQQKPKHSNKASAPGSGPGDPNNPLSTTWQESNKEMLKKIYEKELQKYESEEAAKNFLQDRAKMFYSDVDITPYLQRDWISGYLMEDGHVKAMSVDTSVWQPARTEELIAWMNFTTKPSTKIPKDPYGPEVFLASYVPANQNESTDTTLNPMGDWNETQAMIKAESYSMSAAVYMYTTGGEQKPNPATATPQHPPCRPMQTYSDSGASSGGSMAPIGQEVDAGGSGRPFQQEPPRNLGDVDFSKYPQWMIDKWGRGRGFSGRWNKSSDEIKKKSMLSFAIAEVMERYWKQAFPDAQVFIKSHLRQGSGNHGKGAAMDWEVRYNGGSLYLPNLYTWASSHYLINARRIPGGGGGTYLNMNIPQSNKYNRNRPPGITGIALSEQGRAAAGGCPAPGSSTNTHYDYRGHASHKLGKGKTAWIHLDTDGDGHDDHKGSHKYKAWLKTYHPKGQLIVDFISSWLGGKNMQPPDFKFPQMSNAVPNWNQVSGQEPFGAGNVS